MNCDRQGNRRQGFEERPPTEAWLFAQVILGNPIPKLISPEARARARRNELEHLAQHSGYHAEQLQRLLRAEADARHERELLEFAAKISIQAEAKLAAMVRKEAEERDAWRRAEQYAARLLERHTSELETHASTKTIAVAITEWDADQPRQPKGTPAGGQWAPKDGGAASSSDNAISSAATDSEDQEPSSEMLELARAWRHTKYALRQARSDLEGLPKQIALTRARIKSGGRYALLAPQHLAEFEAQLRDAQAVAPQLERQLAELEKQYHDSGFDEIPYAAWTRGETRVGGKGIEEVGNVLAVQSDPAGVERTGDELSIALTATTALQIGRAVLSRVLAKSAAQLPKLVRFKPGGKTLGVLRTASGDIPLISGRAGPAAALPKGTPGFNAITSTHVEGHAAAIMRQQRLSNATVYINNPRICLPCQQNLKHMLPKDSKLTVVLPDGTKHVFIGNAR